MNSSKDEMKTICPKCNSTGKRLISKDELICEFLNQNYPNINSFPEIYKDKMTGEFYYICFKCEGSGYIEWIDDLFDRR